MRSFIIRFFILLGLFFPALALAVDVGYAGSYSGTFSGGENGTWVVYISSSGVITGSGVNGEGESGTLSGQGLQDGSITIGNVSSGAAFIGTVNSATGGISGTWTHSSAGKSGTWSGSKVAAPEYNGGFTACASGSACTEFNLSFTCPSSTDTVTSCPTSNLLGVCASNSATDYNWKVFAYLTSDMDSAHASTLAASWANSCVDAGNFWSAGNTTSGVTGTKVTQPTALIASGSFAEPNDTPAEATPILVNDQPLFQVFSSPADEDWFEIYAKAGQRYTIDIPAASIGKRINPALELYDAVGNLLVSQVNSDSSGQDKQIRWTAPATGLFRIRVSNSPSVVKKSPATEVFKGEAGDYTYQIHVFLTDAPQQVLTKGRVLDNCGQGINEATVSAWLNNALTDSTLTNKSGEFGLLLNPGHYDLRILAANFQQAGQSVQVGQEATTLAEIKLLPAATAACAANPVAQTQQVPVVYDDQQGILTIKDIVIGDKVYYVTLKNIGDYRFQLSQVLDIPGVIHADPPEYFPNVLIAKLPKVLAFDKAWKVRLKHDGNGILTIESAEPY